MEETLTALNKLQDNGIIGRYAIAGAVAATRYIEQIQTFDADILVMFNKDD